MLGIDRYVYRQCLTVLAFIALGLCFAIWLSQSLRLIELIVNRGVSVGTFLYLAMLLLPRFLEVVLPIATFAAILFTYHRLITDSELVVLRATGFSQARLARPALMAAATASILGLALSLYFLPTSLRAFKDLQFEIRNNFASILLQEGVFNSMTDKITVYIREQAPSGELLGVMIQDERVEGRPATLTAERGALAQTDSGPRIVMLNGTRQELDRKTHRLSVLAFDRYIIELGDVRDAPGARWHEPQERYLPDLFFPSGSQADRYYGHRLTVEGHQRILAPLYPFAYALLALGFLLGGEFNRRGQTGRVMAAIAVAFLVQIGNIVFNNLANRSIGFLPLMHLNVLLPVALGIALMLRRRGARRGAAPVAPAPAS